MGVTPEQFTAATPSTVPGNAALIGFLIHDLFHRLIFGHVRLLPRRSGSVSLFDGGRFSAAAAESPKQCSSAPRADFLSKTHLEISDFFGNCPASAAEAATVVCSD